MISSKSRIDIFAAALGDRKPVPGGGASAALTGAIGAALIMKVANFTIGRKKYRMYEKDAKAIFLKAQRLETKLAAYIEKDARSYEQYSRTRSASSMKKATLCVEEIAALSKEALKYCPRLRKIGNRNLAGDLRAAELFLKASAGAAENLARLNKKWTGR
ncbi:MAG: cyclodeaminase/cyclohydrolase family protein [Candidatus Omnitrophota bacterium]